MTKTNEPEIQVGDKVRITYEGTVTEVNTYIYLDTGAILVKNTEVTVEVIERAVKPKVGDIIRGGKVYDALPVGAVVANDRATLIRDSGGFYDVADREHYGPGSLSMPRTLVFLPGGGN